jgi:hypothetical protein
MSARQLPDGIQDIQRKANADFLLYFLVHATSIPCKRWRVNS